MSFQTATKKIRCHSTILYNAIIAIIIHTVFPRLERACSINFILVLGGGLLEGALRSRAHSIELKPTTSSQFIQGFTFQPSLFT